MKVTFPKELTVDKKMRSLQGGAMLLSARGSSYIKPVFKDYSKKEKHFIV